MKLTQRVRVHHFFTQQPLKLDYPWAALCILGAAYFVYRSNCSQSLGEGVSWVYSGSHRKMQNCASS